MVYNMVYATARQRCECGKIIKGSSDIPGDENDALRNLKFKIKKHKNTEEHKINK